MRTKEKRYIMSTPSRAPHPPNKKWTGFVHLRARFYMNYYKAVEAAAKRKGHRRAVDIDCQISKDGTPWALHWGSVGKNHLRDPKHVITSKDRIANLHDDEIERLRGPLNQKPHRLRMLLSLAAIKRVRVECELKTIVPETEILDLLTVPRISSMNGRGDLQFKTLASLDGAIDRLRAAHNVGGTTILSFTGYRGKGIPKKEAWPVVDYLRGKAKWI